jgi:hypothetical protein
MNKYRNNKVFIDGIRFSSKLESRHFSFMKEAGIEILELQPKYLLQEGFTHRGVKYRPIHYIADFKVLHEGKEFILDSKGQELQEFKLKRKLLLNKYPEINFHTIKTNKDLKLLFNL